ncbi:FAD:protein FMN transferase [Rhodothermus profundi]|uniref:FAD:protein FMN transferase n=1 Tax=Rhodothermus profundi TaxID=633813 RepID=A0A1M6WNN8_9BACT|nr:FAD:protein FMN transferase [Rhodothermus profundi]SHK95209.1 thiamine biosynthesis lipoprotein [Rhodothermus profundi]
MNRRTFLHRLGGWMIGGWLAGSPFRLLARPAESMPLVRLYPVMGTLVRFEVYHPDRAAARDAVRQASALLFEVHRQMSVQEPASMLSRWNASPSGAELVLPALTRQAVAEALRWREITAGRFDPTVGAAVAAWQQGRTPLPQPARQVEVVGEGRFRKWAPVALDLGGSAKGWAVDQAVAVLQQAGCTAGLVNAGGDLRVFGAPPGTSAWQIGIRHPLRPDEVLVTVALRDGALATSGDYEPAGSTLVDPRDLRRVRLEGSVTVWAPTCGAADALATALAVDPDPHWLPDPAGALVARRSAEGLRVQTYRWSFASCCNQTKKYP